METNIVPVLYKVSIGSYDVYVQVYIYIEVNKTSNGGAK